jgi:hypothetical protein
LEPEIDDALLNISVSVALSRSVTFRRLIQYTFCTKWTNEYPDINLFLVCKHLCKKTCNFDRNSSWWIRTRKKDSAQSNSFTHHLDHWIDRTIYHQSTRVGRYKCGNAELSVVLEKHRECQFVELIFITIPTYSAA